MIVVDASILANVVGDDEDDGRRAREVIAGQPDVAVPDLADVETVSVLRRRWRCASISAGRFSDALDDLTALPFSRYPTLPLMRRAYELKDNLTPYDAAYVALAEELECPLLTADGRLARGPGIRCVVDLLRGDDNGPTPVAGDR